MIPRQRGVLRYWTKELSIREVYCTYLRTDEAAKLHWFLVDENEQHLDATNFFDWTPVEEKVLFCTCGCAKVGSVMHSVWCDLNEFRCA